MKRIRFKHLFVLSSWVIFFGSQKSIYASILLLLAGLYMLVDSVWEYRNAKR